MQARRVFLYFVLCFFSLRAGIPSAPGKRVWDLAADALEKMYTIESKVCDLESALDVDFAGTFTVFDAILEKACDNQSLSEEIDISLDELEIDLPPTISKLCVIESKVFALEDDVQNISNSTNDGIFSALDGLQTTLCSKIEQVSSELMQVQNTIANITQSEIDNTATILSKLDVLDDQVDDLNSAIDALSIDTDVNNLDSCTDILVSLADNLLVDVCDLESVVEVGFDGTFTALDAQLAKACDLVSLADVMDPTVMVDFMGVFTSLDELHETVCTIESLVDIVCLINTEQLLCTAGSKIDLALAKICTAESVIDPLASIADEVISILDAVDEQAIMEVCSNIEEAISKLGPIETKIDEINSKVDTWQIDQNYSKLEQIEQTLLTVCSKLDQFDVTDSKLCIVDSKLDEANQEALTIESVVDEINLQADVIDSKIDEVLSVALTVESKVCNILDDTVTICSNLDGLNTVLEEIDSKLDVILPAMQSNVDGLISIESKVEIIDSRICATDVNQLNSKLDNVESIVCTIASNMDVANSLIDNAENKAMDLEQDFAETWTILDVIENKLCISESVLETVSSKLDVVDLSVDLSGVFTVIDTILLKECTIDVKTDAAISLADILIANQGDLSGTFTALDALLEKVCTIDTQVDVIDSNVDVLLTYCGTPIYNADLPLTISIPGRYFVAEDLDYAGTSTAIFIDTSNVTVDLNGHTLTGDLSSVQGIYTSSSRENIAILSGSIRNFGDDSIFISQNNRNILLRNLWIDFCMNGISIEESTAEVLIDSIRCTNGSGSGIAIRQDVSNCIIKESIFIGMTDGIFLGSDGAERTYISHCTSKGHSRAGFQFVNGRLCVLENCISIGNGVNGLRIVNGSSNNVLKDNIFSGNGNFGIRFNGSSNVGNVVINNSIIRNGISGIIVASTDAENNYVAFNTGIENGDGGADANYREPNAAGANTYLGNFAFNSNASGNPDNTNYNIDGGSIITGKFSTVSQTGSFIDRPTKWKNINMLS